MYWPGPSQDSGNANCAMSSPAALSARSMSRIASPRSFSTLADTVTAVSARVVDGNADQQAIATREYPQPKMGRRPDRRPPRGNP